MKININNYEEWMIDYLEGNLSAAQEKELTEFLAFHPELKAELDLFNETKVQPDMDIVFANKESLKKAIGGRVIPIMSWMKYSVAAAAVLMLFVGVRLYNSNSSQQLAIQQYNYEIGNQAIDMNRSTNSIAVSTPTVDSNKNNKIQFANNTHKQDDVKSGNDGKIYLQREINPIQSIEYAKAQSIKVKDNSNEQINLSSMYEAQEEYFAANSTSNKTISNVTDISLNDNKNVIDWWQDAVAIGGEVGEVVEGVRDYDFNPFERKESEIAKTRNISILGFNYYSRKK